MLEWTKAHGLEFMKDQMKLVQDYFYSLVKLVIKIDKDQNKKYRNKILCRNQIYEKELINFYKNLLNSIKLVKDLGHEFCI